MRRYTGFDFDEMFDRMNRQFDEMSREFEGSGAMHGRDVPVDVTDDGDALVVTADLPGYEKEDIRLSASDDLLTVDAERETTAERNDDDDEAYVRRERRAQSVRRTVPLPMSVDEESATATYSNGVLTVTLPKLDADESDPRSIDIE